MNFDNNWSISFSKQIDSKYPTIQVTLHNEKAEGARIPVKMGDVSGPIWAAFDFTAFEFGWN